ncbi:MAG TPA: hypothetical protein VNU71_13570 [Burkholderiaceae bacterium]|nr:hypothetical protein [Burkholderiaceae bacterium]
MPIIPAAALIAIDGALSLLPRAMDSLEARVMLFAIGLQESQFQFRRQLGDGPARGFWQFELGGVNGVFKHPASRYWLAALCKARGVDFAVPAIHGSLEHDDVLAAGVARLLLFTDARHLPALDDERGACAYYIRCWKPGKKRPKDWPANHDAALNEAVPA